MSFFVYVSREFKTFVFYSEKKIIGVLTKQLTIFKLPIKTRESLFNLVQSNYKISNLTQQ